jgi:XTP/dITP diphosphohydrolase
MDTLIFATNNQHKVEETLKEAGINIDIPEPHSTLEENATEKSRTIYSLTHKDCFSEDTGLEVATLNREPGVKSARYAGENRSDDANIQKLLSNLLNENNRRAQFRTVISLIRGGEEHQFEGICEGTITKEQRGEKGFGYDPIFIPDGSERTFAEMTTEEKNKYSHRKKATEKLIAFLKNTC